MNPIYLFLGENQLQINEAIDRIIQKSGIDEEFSCVKYNCDDVPVEVVIEDCRTEPFFDDHKIIIMNHPLFLTSEKLAIEHQLDTFKDYIHNPNDRTILIINAGGYSIDKRKSITKELLKVAKTTSFEAFDEETARQYIKRKIEDNNKRIDPEALNELVQRTECDASRINQELEKIFFFLDDEPVITEALVQVLVSEPLEKNIFNLTNEIIEGKTPQALQTYHKLMKQNEEPIVFSSILAKNFHLMYVIKQYQKKGFSEYQLRSILKIHPYQLKKLYTISRQTEEKRITENIERLADYDRKVKSGKIDKYLGFELFILTQSSIA